MEFQEKIYTVSQVARLTGYGYHYILQLIREGRIECVIKNRRYYLTEQEVLKISNGQHLKNWGGGVPAKRLKKIYQRYKEEIDQLAKEVLEEEKKDENKSQ